MSPKKILLACIVLFVIAAGYLFWQNDRQLNPENVADSWNLSFAYPDRPESLDFTIENFSDDTNFEYTVTKNNKVLEKNSIQVQKTRKTTVKVLTDAEKGEQAIISVAHGKEKKDIYRK